MRRMNSLERKIVSIEVYTYMNEHKRTLTEAYEDMSVPEDMRLSKRKFERTIRMIKLANWFQTKKIFTQNNHSSKNEAGN